MPGPNGAASNAGGLAIWTFQGLALPVWLRQKRSVRTAPGREQAELGSRQCLASQPAATRQFKN